MGDVRAVAYRVRCQLRAQWRSTVALGLMVAAVGGVVLGLAAGAERTSSAPDRYTAASAGRFDGRIEQQGGRPRTAEIAALPAVSAIEVITFVFGGLMSTEGVTPAEGLVFAGSPRAVGMAIAEGREPDPRRPEEFVATRSFADVNGVALGATFDLVTLTQEQADRAGFEAFFTEEPQGPSDEVTLVGIVEGPGELDDPTPLAALVPSLLDRGPGVATTIMSVGLSPGATLGTLRAQLDTLPGGEALGLEAAQLVSPEVRTAVEGQAQGFWLLTAVVGVAAVVVLGQIISRTVRLSAADGPSLRAVGLDSSQLLAESVARAGVPIVVGTVLAVAVGAILSSLFPTGFVRQLEPQPGPRLPAPLVAAVAGSMVVALVLWTVVGLVYARRPRGGDGPSGLVESAAVRCPSAASSTGFRFAFSRSRRDRGSIRATVTGMVFTVALLGGAVVFGSSLVRLVTEGDRFGRNWDLLVGSGGEVVPDDVIDSLEADADVAALVLYGAGQARIGPLTLGLVGTVPVKGELGPRVLSGRLPAGADEIALGRVAARTLGADVGTDVTVDGSNRAHRFRVTGLVVVPPVEGVDGVGQGAVVTMAGLERADPEATPSAAGVKLRPGAPAGTAERLGLGPGTLHPIVIANVARIRSIPFLLAGVVGVLAVLTVAHVMATSVHHRRRDLAVLRSLGADRRWITRVVHWQATSFSLVPLALGIPLGLIAGRLVFRMFADGIGTVPSASLPYAVLIAISITCLALANAVAAVAAFRARHLSPAPLLTTE